MLSTINAMFLLIGLVELQRKHGCRMLMSSDLNIVGLHLDRG